MADRYPVIAGTWDGSSAAIWAAVKDGVPGSAAAPTSGDRVIFDFSGAGFAVTIAAGAVCSDCTFVTPGSGAWTLAGSGAWAIFGSLALVAGLVRTFTGAIAFSATSTGKTIDLAGITLASNVTFVGVGGGWTLSSAFNTSTGTFTHTNGALDTAGFTVTCSQFLCNGSATRVLTLGASTIHSSGGNSNPVVFTATGLTFNPGTSTILLTLTGTGIQAGSFAGLSFYNVTVTCTAYSIFSPISLIVTNTYNASGGNRNTQRLLIRPFTLGTAVTITAAAVVLDGVDFEEVTGAGAATWTGTSIGNCYGCTNITFTAPQTHDWGTNSGNLSDPTKSSLGIMPLPQDTYRFIASSFTLAGQTVTKDLTNFRTPTLDWSLATNAPTFAVASAINFFGGYILSAGVILSGAGAWTFKGRGAFNLTSAGHTFAVSLTLSAPGGSLTFTDAFVSTALMSQDKGDWITNADVTLLSWSCTGGGFANATFNNGGLIQLTGTGNVWNNQFAAITVNPGTSTIKITDTSAAAKTFIGGAAKSYYNLWFAGGTGTFTSSTSNTFNQLRCNDGLAARSLLFTPATITTVSDWAVSGAPGNLVTIGTVGNTGTAFLVKLGSEPAVSDYVSVSRAQGGDATRSLKGYKWWMGSHSTNGGNNAALIFADRGACLPQSMAA